MRAYNYRMNRASYATYLAIFVGTFTILASVMPKPPAVAEVIAAFIAVPRLHDLGRSGWWLLLLFAGEFVAVAIGWRGGVESIEIAGGIYILFALIVLLALGFIPGQSGRNRWGDPPPPGIDWKLKREPIRDNETSIDGPTAPSS